MTPQAISAWLAQSTDVRPQQVVAVTPMVATAIMRRTSYGVQPAQVLLRAEALSPEAVTRGGVLSWEMMLEVDCATTTVRLGATTGYAARTPDGSGLQVAPAQLVWRKPIPGTTLDNVWRAVCDLRFEAPLTGASPRVAQAPGPAATPTPAPIPAAARAAPAPTQAQTQTQTRVAAVPARAATASPHAAAAETFVHNTSAQAPAALAPLKPGSAAVQVVSSPSAEGSRTALAQLRSRVGQQAFEGLDTRIQSAQVGGRTVYRGLVVGFASNAKAQGFCSTLKRGGHDCLVR